MPDYTVIVAPPGHQIPEPATFSGDLNLKLIFQVDPAMEQNPPPEYELSLEHREPDDPIVKLKTNTKDATVEIPLVELISMMMSDDGKTAQPVPEESPKEVKVEKQAKELPAFAIPQAEEGLDAFTARLRRNGMDLMDWLEVYADAAKSRVPNARVFQELGTR